MTEQGLISISEHVSGGSWEISLPSVHTHAPKVRGLGTPGGARWIWCTGLALLVTATVPSSASNSEAACAPGLVSYKFFLSLLPQPWEG